MKQQDETFQQAVALLHEFKGDEYVFGTGCLGRTGELVASRGKSAAVVTSGLGSDWIAPVHETILRSLQAGGVEPAGEMIRGARPNSPQEDVLRIARELADRDADVVLAVGGGSVIDAAKAALAWAVLDDRLEGLEELFGSGQVSRLLRNSGRLMPPLVAVQLAAGSASHLTRYANVTDLAKRQKKLVIDDAVVPERALFDYSTTTTMSSAFTADGALDGVSHCLEVWMGAPADEAATIREPALLGMELILANLPRAMDDPEDSKAREAIGLGTDLGGYAIMLGGTNGAHLTSFSLVDVLPHGRACALMNPYFVVLFAPAITDRLRPVAELYHRLGYLRDDPHGLSGRPLGLAVAEAMANLARSIGFPTQLRDVEGFADTHIDRAAAAAGDPALESKLQNMPIPLPSDHAGEVIAGVLAAAVEGDPQRVPELDAH